MNENKSVAISRYERIGDIWEWIPETPVMIKTLQLAAWRRNNCEVSKYIALILTVIWTFIWYAKNRMPHIKHIKMTHYDFYGCPREAEYHASFQCVPP